MTSVWERLACVESWTTPNFTIPFKVLGPINDEGHIRAHIMQPAIERELSFYHGRNGNTPTAQHTHCLAWIMIGRSGVTQHSSNGGVAMQETLPLPFCNPSVWLAGSSLSLDYSIRGWI